jgi:hypothetical protein
MSCNNIVHVKYTFNLEDEDRPVLPAVKLRPQLLTSVSPFVAAVAAGSDD